MSQLIQLCWTVLGLAWVTAAYAAEITFHTEILKLPPAALWLTTILALVGGLASTLRKLSDPNVVVKSVPLEVAKDLMASLVAGLLSFFFGQSQGISALYQAGLITLSGYGGSRAIDWIMERRFGKKEEA
ncbi:phage holin family protein [Cupriavidus sp. RAF12]|uniref:phage holin family protein n=1 Tax=Cupriavidus sp. RAF12 TaxID=3233050 RepID=UPI003F93D455